MYNVNKQTNKSGADLMPRHKSHLSKQVWGRLNASPQVWGRLNASSKSLIGAPGHLATQTNRKTTSVMTMCMYRDV